MQRTIVRLGILGAAMLLAAGCSTVAVNIDWDHAVDFGRYHSFSWLGAKELRTAPSAVSPLVEQRLEREITRGLEARGLQAAPRKEADLLVAVHTAARERVSVTYAGWGYWRPWGYGGAYVNTWREGTVVLDLIDRDKKQLVWRGIAEGAIRDMAPGDDEIRAVVDKMLAAYPPQ